MIIPRKYRSIGHFFVGVGGFILIFNMISNYNIILGQSCLIMGLVACPRIIKKFKEINTRLTVIITRKG